jgi:hypothetical protein
MLVLLKADPAATTRAEHQAAVRATHARVLPALRLLACEWLAKITHDTHHNLLTVHVITPEPLPPSCIAAIRRLPDVVWADQEPAC